MGVYNRYIPEGNEYVLAGEPDGPAQQVPPPTEQPHPQVPGPTAVPSLGAGLLEGLGKLLDKDKSAGNMLSGVLEAFGLEELDSGDILLVLIILFLLVEGDNTELVITLGLMLLLGLGKKKEKENEPDGP